jgi:hypothetical protein
MAFIPDWQLEEPGSNHSLVKLLFYDEFHHLVLYHHSWEWLSTNNLFNAVLGVYDILLRHYDCECSLNPI